MDQSPRERISDARKVARKAIYRSAVASGKWPGGRPGQCTTNLDRRVRPCQPSCMVTTYGSRDLDLLALADAPHFGDEAAGGAPGASEKTNPSAGFGVTSSTRNAAIFRAHRARPPRCA